MTITHDFEDMYGDNNSDNGACWDEVVTNKNKGNGCKED